LYVDKVPNSCYLIFAMKQQFTGLYELHKC